MRCVSSQREGQFWLPGANLGQNWAFRRGDNVCDAFRQGEKANSGLQLPICAKIGRSVEAEMPMIRFVEVKLPILAPMKPRRGDIVRHPRGSIPKPRGRH